MTMARPRSVSVQRNEAMEDAALALRRIMGAMKGRWARALSEAGLTFPQWVILKTLQKRGRLTSREVADALDCTPANATGILDRMERDELIARERSDDDRRVVFIRLTSKGKRQFDDVVGLAPRALDDMFEGWTTKDFASLKESLGRLKLRPDDQQDF